MGSFRFLLSCRLSFALVAGLLLVLAAAHGAVAAGAPMADPTCAFSDRYPVEIPILGSDQAQSITDLGIDVDDVRLLNGPHLPGVVRAYVNDAEVAQLEAAGYTVNPIPNEAKEMFEQVKKQWQAGGQGTGQSRIRNQNPGSAQPGAPEFTAWPTYDQLVADMQAVAAAHPDICRLINLGTSVQGRILWIMKITSNPDVEMDKPEFKMSSTIHGDEPPGMDILDRMIHYLTDRYGTDSRVTNMINNSEIWLAPLHNPDGYVNGTRYNAHGVDLNRSFPDPITDPNDSPAGREPEVAEYMNLGYAHNFILGGNYHSGSLVYNYPWDCRTSPLAPDNDMFVAFGLGYTSRNLPMWNNPEFYHGITEGGQWYIVHGGIQDWAYNWRNECHVTIELDNTKWPAYSAMAGLWNDNREALLYYMNRVFVGVNGIVTDASTGAPLSASVNALEINKPILSDPDVGDYHRMLLTGTYTMVYTKTGYQTQTIPNVAVVDTIPTVLNVALMPTNSSVSGRRAAGGPLVSLSAPTPNPASGPMRFDLALGTDARVTAAVYDLTGREVRRLAISGTSLRRGIQTIAWDGRTTSGEPVASGLYFLRVTSGSQAVSQGVVVTR